MGYWCLSNFGLPVLQNNKSAVHRPEALFEVIKGIHNASMSTDLESWGLYTGQLKKRIPWFRYSDIFIDCLLKIFVTVFHHLQEKFKSSHHLGISLESSNPRPLESWNDSTVSKDKPIYKTLFTSQNIRRRAPSRSFPAVSSFPLIIQFIYSKNSYRFNHSLPTGPWRGPGDNRLFHKRKFIGAVFMKLFDNKSWRSGR